MTRQGVDLSNWNGNISPLQAQEAKQQGLDFAYVLLTDGKGFRNPDAPQQIAALRSAGILVGFYHFFRPADPVYDQVINFLMYAHGCGGTTLPLALDTEVAADWQTLAYNMMQFARQIENVNTDVTNTHSLLYVNETFYDHLPGFPWGRWVWYAKPGVAAPDKPCLVWQQAPRALPPAFPTPTDYDTFVGSDADWAAFTQQAVVPTTTVTVDQKDSMTTIKTTLAPGLDSHGNGWYTLPQIPDVNKVVSVTFLGPDPTTQGYPTVPIPEWYKDTDRNAIVILNGAPGGQYAVEIEVLD